jgi:hypothetical protein
MNKFNQYLAISTRWHPHYVKIALFGLAQEIGCFKGKDSSRKMQPSTSVIKMLETAAIFNSQDRWTILTISSGFAKKKEIIKEIHG